MAVTRNNLSMKMIGRVGAYSFYTSSGGRQVARIANNSSNYGETAKRTEAMQTRRSRWGNLVSFYSNNKDLMSRAYERKAANLSDYNRYMQLNVPIATVSLVKDAFMRGMAILQEYIIADGSLPEIGVVSAGGASMTFNLRTSLDDEFGELTIGAVSADLLDNNPQLREGDQLTFICWINAGATPETIRIHRRLCELTLDSKSNILFGSLPYAEIVGGNGENISIAGIDGVFGSAIIHSRSVDGNLLVSHAKIKLSSTTMVDQFSSEEEVKKAIASYGVDSEQLLEPGSPAQPKPSPVVPMAKIYSIMTPPQCATLKITDKTTGAVFTNEARLPIGSLVSIDVVAAAGYNIEYDPQFTDPENVEVAGDITFIFKGTPRT